MTICYSLVGVHYNSTQSVALLLPYQVFEDKVVFCAARDSMHPINRFLQKDAARCKPSGNDTKKHQLSAYQSNLDDSYLLSIKYKRV